VCYKWWITYSYILDVWSTSTEKPPAPPACTYFRSSITLMTEGANSCSMRREKCRRIVCLKYESHGLFRSSLAHPHQWLLVWLRILQHMCCIYFRACAQQSKLWLLHFPSCSFLQCPTNDKMYLILLGKITIKRKTLNSQCNYFSPNWVTSRLSREQQPHQSLEYLRVLLRLWVA
jgi:hypothetical protein